jgi:hypothetical protein
MPCGPTPTKVFNTNPVMDLVAPLSTTGIRAAFVNVANTGNWDILVDDIRYYNSLSDHEQIVFGNEKI